MDLPPPPLVLVLALAIEAAVGYPEAVYARIRHPVVWIGALIAWLDRRLNRPELAFAVRRRRGILALLILLAVTGGAALVLERLAVGLGPAAALLVLGLLASSLLAQRSLHDHVAAVRDGLKRRGLPGGRKAVAMIVGRDPESLDEAGVCRAAIESLSENLSDGVTAPALWTGLLGLTGGVLYKAINTADSMIGHKSERHHAFGWAAARLDDLVNLPASRLSAVLIVIAAAASRGMDGGGALRAVLRDAGRHTSPNAGWPEAAFAGALGLKLAGPRTYPSGRVEAAFMGDGRADATRDDIDRALRLYRRVLLLQGFVALLAAVAVVPH
ncbi:adenosylcobinamide-phosphate synthase CbiB [Chthonobacter rhizosphaerae]|uniref:adenosylcobinamide-phosphate synthase CbiB n=1 Tax=Chthonobacter rhizosphaerae TaxID=2735553 RepID=UPI0015EF2AAE|nr:adenosylcobinamide-phosphate synthase CbiB [Chthonobacter rhizosphaerae]